MDGFRDLQDSLAEFVDQRDQPCLLVMISDQDTLFPIKVITDMDRADEGRVYVVCAQPFRGPGPYMDEVVEFVRLQLEAVNGQLRADARPELAPLPAAVLDPRQSAPSRLQAMVQHVGDQVPEGATVVWLFMPTTLATPVQFKELIRPLIPLDGVAPWMDKHRFILRDDLEGSVWVQELYRLHHDDTLVFRFEMGLHTVLDGIVAIAGDPQRTDDERMTALLQVAGFDVAHQRFGEAIHKYHALQGYFGATQNPSMQALALCGMGDALRLGGRPDEALAKYRSGLAVSVPAGAFAVSLTLLTNAGHLCLARSDWAEAEGYFGAAKDVASKLLNVVAHCEALEQRGVARLALQKPREAADDWIQAKALAKKYECADQFNSAVGRLLQLYRQAKLSDWVEQLELEQRLFAAGVRDP